MEVEAFWDSYVFLDFRGLIFKVSLLQYPWNLRNIQVHIGFVYAMKEHFPFIL